MVARCAWAEQSDSERAYHDKEWGVPLHDDQKLFELLCLEGAQAGLSWRTVLEKREGYRDLFYQFDIARCAAMGDDELELILQSPRIIRNRLKVFGVRKNAQAAQRVITEHGSLHNYLWQFVGGVPTKRVAANGRRTGTHRRIRRHEQAAEKRRLYLCREYHLLRVHAKQRHGE